MLCYPSHGLLEDSMKKVSSSSSLLGVVCSVILALAVCNIIVLVSIRQAPQLGALLDRKQQIDRIHSTPVFQMLQAARQKLTTDSATDADIKQRRPQQQQLQLQPQCQLTDRDLQGVLAAAAASTAASGSLLKLFARASALKLRSKLQQEWTAALQPFSAQPAQHAQDARNLPAGFHNDTNSSSASPARSSSSIASPARSSSASPAQGSNCKSVGLAPQSALAKTASSPPKTALLLVLGDWGSLQRMLSLYAINLYTIWCYARQHGYGLELYVHGEPLPHAMPVFFIKVSGVQYLFNTLGYQHVLYLDMDTFTSPHSAPPLSLFYGEFPAASLLLQAEDNLCAAAMLWRNNPDAALLLQAWWDLGAAGCCPTFPHDQTALKHLVLLYAANITGQPWVYPPDTQVIGRERLKDGAVFHRRQQSICMNGLHMLRHTVVLLYRTTTNIAARMLWAMLVSCRHAGGLPCCSLQLGK